MKKKLPPQQEKFCHYYIDLGKASEAYRKAYPKSKKWKNEAVWAKSGELMAKKEIQERIDEIQTKLTAKLEFKKEESVKFKVNLVRTREADFYNENGSIKPMSEWSEEMKNAFKEYKTNKDGIIIGIVLHSKTWADDALSKQLGFNEPEKMDVNNTLHIVDDTDYQWEDKE